MSVQTFEDDETTLLELAQAQGMSDDWIQEEIIASIAAMGILAIDEALETESDPDLTAEATFIAEDDIGEIEVIVRRRQPDPEVPLRHRLKNKPTLH